VECWEGRETTSLISQDSLTLTRWVALENFVFGSNQHVSNDASSNSAPLINEMT